MRLIPTLALGVIVTALACAQECRNGWQGDGYCDPECNTAALDWDSGDCCEDKCTDSANKIYDCGYNGYECRDPTAEKYLRHRKYQSYELDMMCTNQGTGYAVGYYYELGPRPDNTLGSQSGYGSDPEMKDCQFRYKKKFRAPCQSHGTKAQRRDPTCFDMGHIVAEDQLDGNWVDAREVNYRTNILPQATGFNQQGGAWMWTENIIQCSREIDTVAKQVIYGGMVYNDDPRDPNDYFLTSHGIPTPDFYWRVVVRHNRNDVPEVAAWWMPNAPTTTRDKILKRYRASDPDHGALVSLSQLQDLVPDADVRKHVPDAAVEFALDDPARSMWRLPTDRATQKKCSINRGNLITADEL